MLRYQCGVRKVLNKDKNDGIEMNHMDVDSRGNVSFRQKHFQIASARCLQSLLVLKMNMNKTTKFAHLP